MPPDPDVSAQADEYTGAITIYEAGRGWVTAGGTSSSAPIWAALLAVINASPACSAHPATVAGVGFAGPLLYAVASDPSSYAASFNDIASGSNDLFGLGGGPLFGARSGYDLASGLGSPRLTGAGGTPGLAADLCGLGAAAKRPAVSGLSPAWGSTAGGESVTISGGGFEAGGVADVAGIQIGSRQIPPSAFKVESPSSIKATLPPALDTLPPGSPAPLDGAGPADVIVTLANGESSMPGPGSIFQYVDTGPVGAVPSVTGLVPAAGLQSTPGQVTILGSGFTAASHVKFGGVSAPKVTVQSPFEIAATPPPYSPQSACSPLPATGPYAGEGPANDLCQVEVQVTGQGGASATSEILPPLEGTIARDTMGAVVTPPGCGCEVRPAPSEFDYVPAPTISSVSTSSGASGLADESGGTLITVHGTGLNLLTMDWANFGDPAREESADQEYTYLTGTEMKIEAPAVIGRGEAPTVDPATLPFSLRTQAGQARHATLTYAGVPTVTGVSNTASSTLLEGIGGAPDSGGTPLVVTGKGFAGQLLRVQFVDSGSGHSEGIQPAFTPSSDSHLSTQTVAQEAALADLRLCTASGCSAKSSADRIYLYPPGDPRVSSISPNFGPSSGGTTVAIHGANLGCVQAVYFGEVKAAFAPLQTGSDCGSDTELDATAPPGQARTKAPVTVTTLEGYFTGAGRSATKGKFGYRKG